MSVCESANGKGLSKRQGRMRGAASGESMPPFVHPMNPGGYYATNGETSWDQQSMRAASPL